MTTWIVPLVAPVGTVVVISVADTTVNDDEVPLKLTLVVPVRFVPRMIVEDPTFPCGASTFTNGPRPVANLKIEPQPSAAQVEFPS